MIVEKNNRNEIVITDDKKEKRIIFHKHEYLPQYYVTLELGSGNGDAAGLNLVRDAVSWVFNNTPCIMLRGTISKSNPASRAFSLTVPWEQFGETNDEWLFRCGIQYWINNAKDHNLDKAKGKKPN